MLHSFLSINKILEIGPRELIELLFLAVWGHRSAGVDMQRTVPPCGGPLQLRPVLYCSKSHSDE